MTDVLDFGHFPIGSAPTFTFLFKQNGALADPAMAPVLNVTVNNTKTSKTLDHPADGTYTWKELKTVAGTYTATIYAPPGDGEDSQPFTFVVDPDPNYP